MAKLNGFRKAYTEYKNILKKQKSDPSHYGFLMLDRETGEVWTDYFYSLGHNQWRVYGKPSVINLSLCDKICRLRGWEQKEPTAEDFKAVAQKLIDIYEEEF